jgi:hypothetical protein
LLNGFGQLAGRRERLRKQPPAGGVVAPDRSLGEHCDRFLWVAVLQVRDRQEAHRAGGVDDRGRCGPEGVDRGRQLAVGRGERAREDPSFVERRAVVALGDLQLAGAKAGFGGRNQAVEVRDRVGRLGGERRSGRRAEERAKKQRAVRT